MSALSVEVGTAPPLQFVATDQSPDWTFQVMSARAGSAASNRNQAAAKVANRIDALMAVFSKLRLNYILVAARRIGWKIPCQKRREIGSGVPSQDETRTQ